MNDPAPLTLKDRLIGAGGGLLGGPVAGVLYGLFEAESFHAALELGIFVGLIFAILGFVFGPSVLSRLLEF